MALEVKIYMKKIVFILWSAFVFSCSHTEDLRRGQVFQAPKEKVWEALVAILKSYPLKSIEEPKGYIETEEMKADRFWKAPHQKNQDFSGYSSVIKIRLSYREPFSKVFISKKIYKQKGFISAKKEIPSDFLEETVLLYRLSRELNLQSHLDSL